MARIHRRTHFIGAALGGVVALALLTACGSNDTKKPNAVEAPSSDQAVSSQIKSQAPETDDVARSGFQRKGGDSTTKPSAPSSAGATATPKASSPSTTSATPTPKASSPSSTSATATPKASSSSSTSANLPKLTNLEDRKSFKYIYSKELSGPAAERLRSDLADVYGDLKGFVPAKLGSDGAFSYKITGSFVSPDRTTDSYTIGNKTYTEWSIGSDVNWQYDKGSVQSMDADPFSSYAIYWWDENIKPWIEKHSSVSMACDADAVTVNGASAKHCSATKLSQADAISVLNNAGIYSDADTASVSKASFEFWLTDANVPARILISGAAKDEDGASFTGTFKLDFTDIDSKSVKVDLPK